MYVVGADVLMAERLSVIFDISVSASLIRREWHNGRRRGLERPAA